jgi:hypothetical protein
LTDKVSGITRNSAARSFSQRGGALPKASPVWAKSLFENKAMFRFGASAMLRGAALERLDNVRRHAANKQLGHSFKFISCDIV